MKRHAMWLATLFITACGPSRTLPSFDVVTRGTPAVKTTSATEDPLSNLQLRLLSDGKVEDPARYRDKVVVVDVWASWCDPCRESLPEAQALAKELGGKPFELVTVNIDEKDEAAQGFLQQHRLDLRVLRDPGGAKVTRALRVQTTPTTLVFDATGKLRFSHAGTNAEVMKEVRTEVLSLLP